MTELFFEQGIAVDPRVNKDLFTGIARVKEYLKSRKLFIFSSCVNLIREIKGYFWKNQDAPVKKDDNCLDELRYFICSRPENKPPERQKTVIELDKERLIRKLKRRRK